MKTYQINVHFSDAGAIYFRTEWSEDRANVFRVARHLASAFGVERLSVVTCTLTDDGDEFTTDDGDEFTTESGVDFLARDH